jgi:hypothetical protein
MELQEVGENCIMKSYMVCYLHPVYLGDQSKEDKMGGACGEYGGRDRCI